MKQALDKQWRKLIKPKVGSLKHFIEFDKPLKKRKQINSKEKKGLSLQIQKG